MNYIDSSSGGVANKSYVLALPPPIATRNSPQVPSVVLLKIYGCHREAEIDPLVEIIVVVTLAERGLGPKLFGQFPEGRLEEYIPVWSMQDQRSKS